MPNESELWIVAFDLAERYGAFACELAAMWQMEFLRSGDEVPSSTWGDIRRMVADLHRVGPGAGETVQ